MGETRVRSSAREHGLVILGKVSGLHGVKGWVKVYSDTRPRENILAYSPWHLFHEGDWRVVELTGGRPHGKTLVAGLAGCNDRDQAARLLGATIAIPRERLPRLDEGEYYWTDLEGLRVRNLDGADLGLVSHLFATGSNDVIVTRGERERMIPFLQPDVVRGVDLAAGEMLVDWDPDF